MNENGTGLPTISVGWNAEEQQVVLHFDPLKFKTWDFVIACLDMAKAQAEQHRRVQLAQQMQAAAQQQKIN